MSAAPAAGSQGASSPSTRCTTLAAALAEAARDRAERADPDTRPLVENRDREAAAGNFAGADALQKIIDEGNRKLDAERARGQAKAREMAARDAHERFPFWRDQDRPERGPTDRPGVHERARGRGPCMRFVREEPQR